MVFRMTTKQAIILGGGSPLEGGVPIRGGVLGINF